MKKTTAWIALTLAIALGATAASAQNCINITSPFNEVFAIGITGSDGNQHSLALERRTFTTRTAAGSALLTPDAWYFTWSYTAPGATLGWQCEIDPDTNLGTGALTQIFTGSTFNQNVECSLTTCSGIMEGFGRDSEQP